MTVVAKDVAQRMFEGLTQRAESATQTIEGTAEAGVQTERPVEEMLEGLTIGGEVKYNKKRKRQEFEGDDQPNLPTRMLTRNRRAKQVVVETSNNEGDEPP